MSKTSKIRRNTESKNYRGQAVYVPGYEYSPWKKWVALAIALVVMGLITAAFVGNNKTTGGSSDIVTSGNSATQVSPIQSATPSKTDKAALVDKQLTGPYKVVSVIDGDTIDVEIDDKTERLRLIGMDTPETKDPRKPVQCFGAEASKKASELLTGKLVRLESDPSQSERDKYDRLLRYVYFEDGTSYNQTMIAEGYAHEYTYGTPYKYQAEYKQAQKDAEAASKGLWAASTCAGDTEQAAQQTAPAPVLVPTQQSTGNCDPNYSPCIPNVSYDLDCDDIPTSVTVIGTDRHRFDRDSDGYGCESNKKPSS